jgi:Raf kinase inhibitor-like YbhB/YbcL family protein
MRRFLLLIALLFAPYAAQAQGFLTLTSTQIGEGKEVPRSAVSSQNDCGGENISPALDWTGAPKGTKGFALTMFDPDAPNGGYLHWVVFNIPPNVFSLPSDAGKADSRKLPKGALSIGNSSGKNGYTGPCPPVGDKPHHYEFTIYAMPDTFTFYPLSAIGAPTVKWLQEKALESNRLTATYQR